MGSVRFDVADRPARRTSVAILVNNVCTYDSRVIKGAEELAQRGYRVAIFAVKAGELPDLQVVRDVTYRRLPKKPASPRNAAVSRRPRRENSDVAVSQADAPVPSLQQDLADLALLFLAFLLRERYATLVDARANIEAAVKSRLKRSANMMRSWMSRANARIRVSGSTPKDLIAAAIQTVEPPKSDRAEALVRVVASRNEHAVEAFRPDIIHCHDVDCIVAASTLSRSLNCPFIYDVHELCAHRWDRSDPDYRASIASIEGRYIGDASGVVTVSEDLADELRQSYGLQALPIYNAPRADLTAKFDRDLRSDLQLPADVPLAVYTGVLAVTRGLERFFQAMQSASSLHFAMVGKQTPDLIASFTELGKELGISDRIHFVAAVPFDAVSAYISSATFGVIPAIARTRNQKVGLPNKLFEMMFAGLPILIGDIPQRRRVLKEHGEGVFFPDLEDVDLGPYILEIMTKCADPAFRENCRRKGRLAATRVGWQSQMDRLMALYDEALGTATASTQNHVAMRNNSPGKQPAWVSV